ncbi:MAG: arylsulfatase [Ilumatobacteraceae bacterium]
MSDRQGRKTFAYPNFDGVVGETFARSTPSWPQEPSAPTGAPNIVFVIADDLGYSDLGCYGSEIDTPNIDALAGRGLRYTNFHVTPLCSPTRAAFMTGRNNHAVGMGYVANIDPGFPGYASELPANQPSLPETLRANGYSTLAVGKWHLAKDADLTETGDKSSWPLQRGFEQYYGFLEALTNFWHPHRLYEGNSVIQVDKYSDDYYLTDDLTDRAVRMMKDVKASNPSKPFFLYFAHGAVHAPLHAKPSDIAKYKGVYDCGWDVLRERRFARQKELGLLPPEAVLPPRNNERGESVEAWETLSDDQKSLYARYMEVYAGMVDNIDQSVGRLVKTLEDLGELDNTVFIFTSDNGASREGNERGARSYFRGFAVSGDNFTHRPEDFENLDEIGGPTSWPHYPRGWAMACNTPFRLYKITTHRGGHQVPYVMSWPNRIAARGDVFRRQFTHITDMLPTLLELVGVEQLTSRNGLEADPIQGVSFVETLDSSDSESKHKEQYWECIGHRAYYRDGWEVVTFHLPRTSFATEKWQLFDTNADPTQANDLADQMPEKVAELVSAWEAAAVENQVYPLAEGVRIEHLQRPPSERVYAQRTRILRGAGTLERFRSAKLIQGRSFRVEVDWDYRRGDAGILLAHGGQENGYVLYVEDGALHFEQNTGLGMKKLTPVPLGESSQSVAIDVVAPGNKTWTVALETDSRKHPAVEGFFQPYAFLPYEGIDIGIDRRSPVSWDLYSRHGTFPFSGAITAVTYVPGDLAPDVGPHVLEEAIRLGLAID